MPVAAGVSTKLPSAASPPPQLPLAVQGRAVLLVLLADQFSVVLWPRVMLVGVALRLTTGAGGGAVAVTVTDWLPEPAQEKTAAG